MANRRLCFNSEFKVRADPATNGGEKKYIEGYFVVYDTEVQIFEGYYEKIARGALDESIANDDIRCLFNHDTGFVLGRTGNNTVSLKSDAKGLYGVVEINQNDRQAVDVYERVKRGDIATCSFGFYENESEPTITDNGLVMHNIVTKAKVFEISVCPFAAYEDTEITARTKSFAVDRRKNLSQRKALLKNRLEALKNAKTN